MRWLGFAVVPALLGIGAANPPQQSTVAYQLSPEMKGDAIVALDVTVRLRADRSGITTVDWIDSWAGERKLGQWARDIRVEGGGSVATAPNGGRIIRSAPGAPLIMRYKIVSAYAADPTVKDSEQAAPVVRPGWFYSVGEVLYARPVGSDQAPASFVWKGPTDIGFASDTEHVTGLLNHPRTVGDILESIAIGGRDLAVSSVTLNGAPLRVAHVGTFGFDIHALEKTAQKVVAAERDFWRDTRAGPFLITAIPLVSDPGRLSMAAPGGAMHSPRGSTMTPTCRA